MSSPIEQVLENLSADQLATIEPIEEPRPLPARACGPDSGSSEASASFVADSILAIPVTVQVVLGTARLPLSKIAELRPGSVINLDQKIGTPATILVNGREVAKGDIFVLDGEGARLGITITEVISVAKPQTAP